MVQLKYYPLPANLSIQPKTASAELIDLAEDALRFALTHRAICDIVPLQLYDSALIFSPEQSQVRQNFNSEISANISLYPSSFQHWDACLFNVTDITDYDIKLRASPGGEKLAMIGHHGTILVVDSFTGEIVRKIKSHRNVKSVVGFDAEGKHLAAVSRGRVGIYNVMIWNTRTGEFIRTFEIGDGIVVLSQDRMSLASAKRSGLVRVCDPWDGSEKYTIDLRHGEGGIEWIDFGFTKFGAPCLFSVISTRNGERASAEVVVQNPQTGHVIARASLTTSWYGFIFHAALGPDCKRLLISQPEELQLWDGETLISLRHVFEPGDLPYCYGIAWAPDGRSFAMATRNAVILCDPTKQARIGRISSECFGNTRPCYVSGTTLAVLDSGSLKMLRVRSTLSEATFVYEHASRPIYSLNPGPYGRLEVSRELNHEIIVPALDNTLRRLHIPGSYSDRKGVFSPNHQYALVDGSGLINIWDTDLCLCLYKLRGHANDTESSGIIIEFDSSGQLISANHEDGGIRIWNPTTGDCLRTIRCRHWFYIHCMAASADGRIAIAPGDEDILYTWDLGAVGGGKREWIMTGTASCLSFNSNGLLAVLDKRGKHISILDVSLGTCLKTYHLPSYLPYAKFHAGSNSRIDVGRGVLDLDLEELAEAEEGVEEERFTVHGQNDEPSIWNQQLLKVSLTKTGSWLKRGSKKVLWVPPSTADSIRVTPNFDTGASMISMIYNSHALIVHVRGS